MRTLSILLGSLALASLATPATAPRGVLAYEKIAADFARANGLPDAAPDTLRYEDVLAQQFVRLELGAFDVRFPRVALATHAEAFKTSAQALVTAQEQLAEWIFAGTIEKTLREDLKTLQNWVKGWKVPALQKGKTGPETDVAKLTNASAAQLEAGKRVFDALAKGAALGPAREKPVTSRLVLLPTRKLFAEFVYFAGWVQGDLREALWLDSVPDWTQCYVFEDQAIAFEYGIPNRPPSDYTSGMPMDTILSQQIAQLGMNSLLSGYYKERVPGALIGGLSMNLVIDAFGSVETRVDGDTRSKVTAKREIFVAGGASDGGLLAKNSADTKWRENGGRDHFLTTLRAAQEDGLKLVKDPAKRHAVFAIRSDDGGEKWAAVGPFFGAQTEPQNPAAKFQGDYAEFLRAYKSAFLYWLQVKSQGPEKPSREKFALLLKKLADPNLAGDFDAVFPEVYAGAALSGASGGDQAKEPLEAQFLAWLSKQK